MKKLVISLLAILLFSPFIYPQKSKNIGESQGIVSDSLRIGNELLLDDSSVKFIRVISDSRCPKSVKCIWQGEVKVLLGVYTNQHYFEKVIVISSRVVNIVEIGDLEISILDLSPYPLKPVSINPKEYCLELSVAKQA